MNFLSLLLVSFSVVFLWWLNFNIMNVPRLFLYVDFFGPLFYLFIMIFCSFLVVKLLFKELTYKFLVDYLAKNSILKVKNFKFIDLFLNSFNSKGFRNFSGLSFFSSYYMKSFNFNSLVVLIFLIFLIV